MSPGFLKVVEEEVLDIAVKDLYLLFFSG